MQKPSAEAGKAPEISVCEGAACSVCERGVLICFRTVEGREYLRCSHCEATLMAQASWLAPDEERAVYDLHDNDPGDPGYREACRALV